MSEVVNANRGDAITHSKGGDYDERPILFPWVWELGKPAVKNTASAIKNTGQ